MMTQKYGEGRKRINMPQLHLRLAAVQLLPYRMRVRAYERYVV